MRVRMIFSTRYCGLVPWMLCASFTVRFAMAASARRRQLPPAARFRHGPRPIPLPTPSPSPPPPPYFRAGASFPAPLFGRRVPGTNMAELLLLLFHHSPPPPRARFGGKFHRGARAAAAATAARAGLAEGSGERGPGPEGSGRVGGFVGRSHTAVTAPSQSTELREQGVGSP